MVPFFILSFLFVMGLGIAFASVDRIEVMGNWDQRRCDFPVVIGGAFYKPTQDSRSGFEFASENFQFCTNKLIQETLQQAMAPFLSVLKDSMGSANVVGEVQNSLQIMLGNFFRSFSKIVEGVFNRFMMVSFELRRIFIEFFSAMNRAFAIALDVALMGIAMVTGIDSFVQFVIRVVIIIMGILAALIILLFFILIPVIPVIMATIAVLTAGGIGAAKGFGGAFCFIPSTPVQKQDGSTIPIKEIKVGDILQDGSVVEGVLRTSGKGVKLFKLHDITVSGDHLVYYPPLQQYILVKEHPEAWLQYYQEKELICLNTSTRKIPLGNDIFRDWEELPSGDESLQREWNSLVAKFLKTDFVSSTDHYPIFTNESLVFTESGTKSIEKVVLGEKVRDKIGFTTVLGIYKGEETFSGWHSESIWFSSPNNWHQEKAEGDSSKKQGYHLITDSGTFLIGHQDSWNTVRDFTEVGVRFLPETYSWMKKNIT
jgi:hypothetical protein